MAHEGARSADEGLLDDALACLLLGSEELPASELTGIVDLAGTALGATAARVLIADYALLSLQALGEDGPTGARQLIEGTLAGRALARDEIVVAGDGSGSVFVPLADGSERMGVLELTHPAWTDEVRAVLDPVVRLLVLVLISKRRYTDLVVRSRRSERLSPAAELQWDLLPPLTCSTAQVAVSGILEPAYSIGGDSFDYALNPGTVDFAIIDAVGHGMSAVMISVATVNSLRNARREGIGLEAAYLGTGAIIEREFGERCFATGQFGSLTLDTGALTWLNAGHPLPLLVRNGTYAGELECKPSLPMGLGGKVVEVATVHLQRGDRVLFFTDGVTETRSTSGEPFGLPRLSDFLVRATLDRVHPAETVRRLSTSIVEHNGASLTDDATLLLIDYHGSDAGADEITRRG